MNYQRIYDQFISDRKSKEAKISGYFERHHILPKSLGGSNCQENIIKLTFKDHVFAHRLLAKIYGGPMHYALWMMLNRSNSGRSESAFVEAKKNRSILMSENFSGENHYRYGQTLSEDVKKKISSTLKRRHKSGELKARSGWRWDEKDKKRISRQMKELYLSGVKHPMLGRSHTKESRDKISKSQIGPKNNNFGKPLKPEHAKKIRDAQVGLKNHYSDKRKLNFLHDTGVFFVGHRCDFIKNNGLSKHSVSKMILGKQRKHKGWVFCGVQE